MNKKGFTLIELLIVISIIGILAVAFVPSLLNAPAKGRDTARIQGVNKLVNLLTTLVPTKQLTITAGIHCLDPTLPANVLAQTLYTNYLPDLGGVFPEEPQDDRVPTSENRCVGSFMLLDCGGNTPVFISASVEDESNGNNTDSWTCDPLASMAESGPYYVGIVSE